MNQEKRKFLDIVNKPTLFPAAVLLTILVFIGLVAPDAFKAGCDFLLGWTLKYFGWLYAAGSTALLVFCIWAGFSKYGKIKLGGPNAKPEFGTFTWWAMTLIGGIAIGIVFYGVAEPMMHYASPPPFLGADPGSANAAADALRLTYFHWTFHTYGIYVSTALCTAFFFYNCKKSFKFSAPLSPILGDRVNGGWGHLVDGLGIFAIVGGVGTSMGFGVLQFGGGLQFIYGIKPTTLVWFLTVAVLLLCYMASSYSGIHRGIKMLSRVNIFFYFFLMLFVLCLGPFVSILDNTVTSIGRYFSTIVEMSFNIDPMGKSGWPQGWSIFYWAWWLAYAPMVGLFLARIAYGRTIRAFVICNLIAPSTFGLIWFGIFGGAAIHFEHFEGANIGALISELGIEVALFALFQQYPLQSLTMFLGLLVICISFITMADSMTTMLGKVTCKDLGDDARFGEPPVRLKFFWGILMGLLAFVLLVTGGIAALQTSVIVCGLPILIVQLFMVVNYGKAMGNLKKYDVVSSAELLDYLTYSPANAGRTSEEK